MSTVPSDAVFAAWDIEAIFYPDVEGIFHESFSIRTDDKQKALTFIYSLKPNFVYIEKLLNHIITVKTLYFSHDATEEVITRFRFEDLPQLQDTFTDVVPFTTENFTEYCIDIFKPS